mmetsp:Transcript_6892/g.10909  ORF Transcript_6892/g.10909 Transcript_6892/m.10909 type:complete len:314 (+) Transcript_6892:203-1144(+)
MTNTSASSSRIPCKLSNMSCGDACAVSFSKMKSIIDCSTWPSAPFTFSAMNGAKFNSIIVRNLSYVVQSTAYSNTCLRLVGISRIRACILEYGIFAWRTLNSSISACVMFALTRGCWCDRSFFFLFFFFFLCFFLSSPSSLRSFSSSPDSLIVLLSSLSLSSSLSSSVSEFPFSFARAVAVSNSDLDPGLNLTSSSPGTTVKPFVPVVVPAFARFAILLSARSRLLFSLAMPSRMRFCSFFSSSSSAAFRLSSCFFSRCSEVLFSSSSRLALSSTSRCLCRSSSPTRAASRTSCCRTLSSSNCPGYSSALAAR